MFLRKKIPCYVLVFDQIDIIRKSLNYLSNFSNELDLIVVENPSDSSPEIKKYLNDLGGKKLIKRHYLMKENVTGVALKIVIESEKAYVSQHKYIIFTDGDVTVDTDDWLEELKKILSRDANVFACGTSLDTSNLPLENFPEATGWLPPDKSVQKNYYEALTGAHLLMMRPKELFNAIKWISDNGLTFVDGNLHKYCYDVISKKWARTKEAKAYHLTWDLYADKSHPYTKFKLSKSFRDTWYHNRTSEYKLTEY